MADVFTNDLRIREQEVGANSGSWGGYLNTSLENIAEAFSYGTEALADSAAQTLTLADGASDELRSFYVKLTGTLSQATTVTLAPNTISKVWMIENATTGGYDVTISQGSGANVTVGNGNVKMIATDGAGAGGVVYDLLTDLELAGKLLLGTPASRTMSGVTPNFFVEGTSYASSSYGAVINANGSLDSPLLLFGKSRGTALGSNTIVQNGDRLFSMRIDGSDGTNLEQAAIIEAYVDAAPTANSIPGRLTFLTTNSGDQYATEKMRLDNAGNLGLGTSSPTSYYSNTLHLYGSASAAIKISNSDTGSTNGDGVDLALDDSEDFRIIQREAANVQIYTSGNLAQQIDANGHVTMPLQSAFLVQSATQNNIAVDSNVTVTFSSEVFDQNADFNTSTYTFTAPVTGRYYLSANIRMDTIDTAVAYYRVILKTSNRDIYGDIVDAVKIFSADANYMTMQVHGLVDMDASDTAYVLVYQANGTSQTDIPATNSNFSGFLVC